MSVILEAHTPSLISRLTSILDRLDLEAMFGANQPVEIELGSGDGSFLAEYARRNPRTNFIGIERLLGRLRKLDRKGRRAGLTNLRGLRIECAYFLEFLMPRHSAKAVHVYFPDPWPKRKHQRHRLVNDRFPGLSWHVLMPGGRVYLRTDDADYFEQMTAVFSTCTGFRSVETPVELSGLVTDFEADFNARGIRTLRAAYQRE